MPVFICFEGIPLPQVINAARHVHFKVHRVAFDQRAHTLDEARERIAAAIGVSA